MKILHSKVQCCSAISWRHLHSGQSWTYSADSRTNPEAQTRGNNKKTYGISIYPIYILFSLSPKTKFLCRYKYTYANGIIIQNVFLVLEFHSICSGRSWTWNWAKPGKGSIDHHPRAWHKSKDCIFQG